MFSQPGDMNMWFKHYPERARPPVVLNTLLEEQGTNDITASEWRTVHRLDACVTGGMLIAKNKNAAIQFNKNLRKGGYKGFKIRRRYVAQVEGKVAERYLHDEGIITSCGMISKYRRFDENCLILELVTGGKHQIRRHLSEALNTPIHNDIRYHGPEIHGAHPKQIALHSASINTAIGFQRREHLIPMIYNNDGKLWNSKYVGESGHFIAPIQDILSQEWKNTLFDNYK